MTLAQALLESIFHFPATIKEEAPATGAILRAGDTAMACDTALYGSPLVHLTVLERDGDYIRVYEVFPGGAVSTNWTPDSHFTRVEVL